MIKILWSEVIRKYGKETADKMKKSEFLIGNTVTMTDDGELDIPERDIGLAYKDVTRKKIYQFEWD